MRYSRARAVVAATAAGLALSGAVSATATRPFGAVDAQDGMPNAAEVLGVSALSPSDAWAVGLTPTFDSVVEHWDGTGWSATPGVLTDLGGVDALSSDDVWAVGSGGGKAEVQHWDGSSWTLTRTPDIKGFFEGVDALSPTDAWAVGQQFHGHTRRTLIEHWDGQRWSRQVSDSPDAKGIRSLRSVQAISSTDAWAIGDTQRSPIVEHWDGQAWRHVKTPHLDHDYFLSSVDVAGPDDVWVVGGLNVGFPVLHNTLAMHWDGTSWTVTATPSQPDEAFFNSVEAISTDDVWAVGQALVPERSEYRTLIEHWDGTSWTQVPSPNPTKTMNNVLNSVSADSADDAWTVGTTYLQSDERGLVLHWDGDHWTT